MDNFKSINDQYGHLVGDEILRNIGHLLRSSIRQEDEAFRWGGDEFVILFGNQNLPVVKARMLEIRRRLSDFRVRGYGALPISFSWGVSEAASGQLRQVLDMTPITTCIHSRSGEPPTRRKPNTFRLTRGRTFH